jgi:5-dehydro-2-deoxygluconokinase
MNDELFILAFDHRGSFKAKMFGITGRDETSDETAALQDAKRLVYEGALKAIDDGLSPDLVGVLVDEEMGADVARDAKERGIKLAMPVEASGQPLFDFEYGDEFGDHITAFDSDYSKVLVRWNPDDDPEDNRVQGERLKRLGDWLRDNGRTYLFELLVPATAQQLTVVESGADYDTEIRPYLTLQAIRQILDAGVEPDIWKIEGLDRRRSCELLSGLVRSDGRDEVIAVVLGRGADDAKVDHWLRMGSGVTGYAGFAIGRSIWWGGVEGFKNGTMSRADAVASISANYRRFIDVYQGN